jgi:hypothetical protein
VQKIYWRLIAIKKCVFCRVCRLYSSDAINCNSDNPNGRRCGRYRELKNLTKAVIIFGDSLLVGVAVLALWVFYSIETQGYFRAMEANSAIITFEVALAFLGLSYGVIRWVRRVYKYARYEVIYRANKQGVD